MNEIMLRYLRLSKMESGGQRESRARPKLCRTAPTLKAGSSIAGGNDRRGFDHKHDRTLGSAGAVDDPLGHDESLSRRELYGPAFEIDDEATVEHHEEFIVFVVLVPVVFTLQHAQPDDGVVHFAERLVVPAVGARLDQRRNIDQAQFRESNVEVRGVGIGFRLIHFSLRSTDLPSAVFIVRSRPQPPESSLPPAPPQPPPPS